jgi:2-succinyl-5-enolpyruvyl-6-hydroxy-3-cyclohexene-1-carboxylate synthase
VNLQATFASTLVDEWARGGVTHAVVAPGSRSTPLALALAADPRIVTTVVLDERGAGFAGLGLGLATGRPAVVLTTSGTAAVNLHPAVVEAHQARVPLLVCTADRPPELHHVGAPQTIEQERLFAGVVRWMAAPGVADAEAAGTWRSLAARALAETTGHPSGPGPVHLDLAFREPLVGEAGPLLTGRPGGRPWHRVAPAVPPPADDLVGELAGRQLARGVIVAAGRAGDPAAVHELAAVLGWPVLADPRSGCRVPAPATVAAADALLRSPSFAAAHRPEVVLQLGGLPASRVVGEWAAASGADHYLVDPDGAWPDPARTAAVAARCDPTELARRVAAEAAGLRPTDPGWLASWRAAEDAAQEAFDRVLAAEDGPTEPAVARRLAAAVPGGATLVVSSSMPVRDLEWYAAPRTGLRVLANRGANGIDGVASTALGVALAGPAPTVALLGDLAFLHDATGLLALGQVHADLTVVVVDNDGGGIFSFLPQAAQLAPDRFERLLGTPHGLDLVAVARALGVPAERVADLDAVAAAVATPGPKVVVVATDRRANVAAHDRLHAAVAAALHD